MPMRAPKTESVSESGVHRVMATFNDLGWAPTENKSHDLGTDIFLQVRERGFDLGVMVGVQVKSGASFFNRAEGEPSAPDGWWYAESTKDHFDYWTGHALPHLLVLHDNATDASYWVHITAQAVEDTGKGAKILVPSANTLDESHLDRLFAVAAARRPEVPLEGTAWAGGAPTASADQMRFAMIAPRLIASRQRDWFGDAPTPEQVVALMARARFNIVDDLRPTDSKFVRPRSAGRIPSVEQARESADWRWRFVAAFEARILRDDRAQLREAIASADTPDRRAAATVALAAALVEDGSYAAAISCLTAVIENDDTSPIDEAWLHIQRARAHLELGELAAAREDADSALGVRNLAPHDLTASAIDGAARALIYSTASWEQQDFGSVIQAADTAVAWWRSQMALGGLEAVTERTFKAWADDQSRTIGRTDDANNQLYVAALAAGHAGDHGAWRDFFTLLAQDTLLRLNNRSPAKDVAVGLGMLRQAGAKNELKRASGRVANNGPCEAITIVANTLDFTHSTSTTIFADLTLVKNAGDLFSAEAGDRCLTWLTAGFDDPSSLLRLTFRTSFDPEAELLEAIAGLTDTLPDAVAEFVVTRLPHTSLEGRPLQTERWRYLLRALTDEAWTPERVDRLTATGLPKTDHPLRFEILGAARRHLHTAQLAIEDELRTGSLQALLTANQVHDLDGSLLTAVRTRLVENVAQLRSDSAGGIQSIGGLDPAYALGVIILSHPSKADADCLVEFLADESVPRSKKQPLLRLMADRAAEFRALMGERLPDAVATASRASPGHVASLFDRDPTGEAVFIVEVLRASEPEYGIALSTLLAGDASQRKWAARLAADAPGDDYVAAVLTLARDQDPLVRQQAAAGMARLAIADRGGEVIRAALRGAIEDPGRAVPLALAAELAHADSPPDDLDAIRVSLLEHASAAVRTHAIRKS